MNGGNLWACYCVQNTHTHTYTHTRAQTHKHTLLLTRSVDTDCWMIALALHVLDSKIIDWLSIGPPHHLSLPRRRHPFLTFLPFHPWFYPRLHPHPPQSLCKLAVEPGQAEAIFSSSTAEQKLAEGHVCAAESKGVSRQCAVNKGKVSSRRWDTQRLCVGLVCVGTTARGRPQAWVENKRSDVNGHVHMRPAHCPLFSDAQLQLSWSTWGHDIQQGDIWLSNHHRGSTLVPCRLFIYLIFI